ncbi:helix-turn-helix domain-containing protein [Paraprevotella xylaniphila]|uniref:helix-turn-helix domain-containing protein n=1 Tax=Paraprevotella xylaniphila TaxID=454155 RepID=UPI0024A8AC75|nr:helix-turn-helix transcriptional regulator [Paraprevotella xylaniphila]
MKGDVIDRLNRVIEYMCITPAELAKKSDVDPSNFNKMLKGQLNITPKTIKKIVNATGVSNDWLSNGDGEMLSPQSNNVTINGNENQNNIGGQMVNISLPEKGSQKIIKPDGTVEVHSMDKNIENSNNTDKFIELLKKKDEQIDRLITLLENK